MFMLHGYSSSKVSQVVFFFREAAIKLSQAEQMWMHNIVTLVQLQHV
jgi:hypothetical protein